jgi:hypothetical protein
MNSDLSNLLVEVPEYPLGKNLNLLTEKLWLSASAEDQALMVFFYVEGDLAIRELASSFEDVRVFHDRSRGNRIVVKLERLDLNQEFVYVMHEIAAGMERVELGGHLDFFMLELEKWSAFLAPKREGISESELLGLWGELYVLSAHLIDRLEPIEAIGSYVGLRNAPQDIAARDFTVEVKTTTQKTPKKISISSLEQLDAWPARQLLTLILASRTDTGISVSELLEGIEKRIRTDSKALRSFRLSVSQKLENASEAQLIENFSPDSEVAWEVTQDFPALRRSQVATGVVDASYDIGIVSLIDYKVDCTVGEWIDGIRAS